ncbi:hypothetical protein ES705_16826 [subsurface metagenome]
MVRLALQMKNLRDRILERHNIHTVGIGGHVWQLPVSGGLFI